MITGSVRIDISREPGIGDEGRDRKALWPLFELPAGVTAYIAVGSRSWVSPEAAGLLFRAAKTVHLHFEGTPSANIGAWIAAASSGDRP